MFQHVWNATCAEGYGLHAAGVDIAFVDHGGVQVTRHIDCTGGNQIEAPWHRAQNRQRAGIPQLSRVNFDDFRFGGVVKISDRSGRVRPCSSTGAFSLLTITPVMLVFSHRRSCCASVRYALSAALGYPCLRHYKTISAFRVFAISKFRDWANWCLRVGTGPSTSTTSASCAFAW